MAGAGLRRGDDPRAPTAASRTGSDASPTSGPARRTCASKPFQAKIKVDGVGWYKGKASCILLGNVGELFGGVEAFEDARPDDGRLELGVVTAEGLLEWGAHARPHRGRLGEQVSRSRRRRRRSRSRSSSNRKVLYELDGGDRIEGQGVQGQGRGRRRSPSACRRRRMRPTAASTCATVDGRAGASVRPLPRLRVPLARGLRRAGPDLRDHRDPRPEAGARSRRQADEPAGRAAHGRASAVRQGPADAGGDRPRRLRALALRPGRDRARPGRPRQRRRPGRRAGERHRLRRDVRPRRRDPGRLARAVSSYEPEEGDGRRLRLALRHLDRRDRRRGADRRRPLPGVPRGLAQVPRRLEDGRDEPVGPKSGSRGSGRSAISRARSCSRSSGSS